MSMDMCFYMYIDQLPPLLRFLGPEECNLGCLDACVIVCLLARWPDLDEFGRHFGGFGSLLVPTVSLWYHLGLLRVANIHK